MKILSIIYDGGSRIPGARFAPTKYYQEAMLYDRKDSDIITINLGNQDLFSIDLESLSRTIAESKVQIALGSFSYLSISKGHCSRGSIFNCFRCSFRLLQRL